MVIKRLKKIYCVVFSCVLLGSTASLNAFAWGTSTHRDIYTGSLEMLKNDKPEVYSFVKQDYTKFRLMEGGTMSPDWEEHRMGTHLYVCKGKKSDFGNYYKNTNGSYSRTARTRFELHYNTAVTQYKNGFIEESFDSLGRAIHYLCDIGCPLHSAGVLFRLSDLKIHPKFETYGDDNAYKFLLNDGNKIYDEINDSSLEYISNSLGTESVKSMHYIDENNVDSYNKCLQYTIPLSQEYTAAIINKFYNDVRSAQTEYIKDGAIYLIKNDDNNMYMDAYYKNLKLYKTVCNEFQQFKAHVNSDGTCSFTPISDPSKAISVSSTNSVVLDKYTKAENQKFKVVFYPGRTARIVCISGNDDHVLGKAITKSISLQSFSPDDSGQRFRFIEKVA